MIKCLLRCGLIIIILFANVWFYNAYNQVNGKTTIESNFDAMRELPITLNNIQLPVIKDPDWLSNLKKAESTSMNKSITKIINYSVSSKGVIKASVSEFKQQANSTLNDGRGWSRLGVRFQEVANGGSFTLILSEAEQLPVFSIGCSVDYSCNVGDNVIINQDRWLGATTSWNNSGGSLRDYRHMVINHETGHWLGHGHSDCEGSGSMAPVMQQQSISLQGCLFNPWPTSNELWSTKLGIRL